MTNREMKAEVLNQLTTLCNQTLRKLETLDALDRDETADDVCDLMDQLNTLFGVQDKMAAALNRARAVNGV